MFSSILGHQPVLHYLTRAIEENRLPNTLLFSGMEGIGKRTVALALTCHLLRTTLERIESGNHPDFHFLLPEGKSGNHSIESIRKEIDQAHAAPFEAPAKVFLVEAAERMQPAAANALLKTLEEPSLDSYWILLTSSPQEILPTIRSRAAPLSFAPLSLPQVGKLLEERGHPAKLSLFSQGSVQQALELAAHPEAEEAREVLFSLLRQPVDECTLFQATQKIEKLLETEDPLVKARRAAHLFRSIALYYRDQELRQVNSASPHLFFPQEPTLPAIRNWEKALDTSRLAFDRNIKLSTCLQFFFLAS